MKPLPSTTSLRVFEACGRLGSCTGAAQELALSPGAVSKQLKSLEETLGLTLFVRSVQGLVPTAAGSSYLASVQALLTQLEAAATRAHAAASQRRSLLLHVLPTLADRWLLPRYAEFALAHPDIDVQFTNQLSSDGAVTPADASFRYGLGHWPGQRSMYLTGRELRLVASPALLERSGGLRSAREVLRYTLLQHFELPEAWREFFRQQGLRPKAWPGSVRYGFFSVLIRGALTGMGLALVPTVLVADELRAGTLVNPLGLACRSRSGYYLVWPQEREGDPALGAFCRWMGGLADTEA
ncbi:MAG: LysR family transcriptional regulator [Rubrivivax sp.]|nr:LysR family transcriptional regulator [Rubrivivax sp.]